MSSASGAQQSVDLASYAIMSSFARSTQSARLLSFLLRIDGVDRWAVDYKEDEAPNALEIKSFLAELQSFLNAGGMGGLQAAPRQFLELLGGLRSSRCLYLLKLVSVANPVLADQIEKLLLEAGSEERLILVVRRRLEAFTKAQLLGDIFSNKRLERIKLIMGGKK
jgi:hypothetical protein